MFPDMLGLIYPFLLISFATSSLGQSQQQQEKRDITDGEGVQVKTMKVIKTVHPSTTNAYKTNISSTRVPWASSGLVELSFDCDKYI